jgi:hypothetical protein
MRWRRPPVANAKLDGEQGMGRLRVETDVKQMWKVTAVAKTDGQVEPLANGVLSYK